MADYRAIDVIVFPFTPDTKAGPYEQTKALKDVQVRIGIWENEFTAEQLIADMDANAVEKALICSQAGGSWEVSAEYVREMIAPYPERLHGLCGIDPRDIVAGLKKLEVAIREYGFVGAHSYPHWFGLSPDDRSYYPFYAKCVELDIPIEIQVGQAWQATLRNVARPSTIDSIAVDFPDLRIVGIHTGYPWEREMISVAWKHPNVFIGADAFHPKNWAPELIEFIKGEGREKVCWGTDKPALEFREALEALDEFALDAATESSFLYENTKRIFRL